MSHNERPPGAPTLGGHELETGASNDTQTTTAAMGVENRRPRRIVIEIDDLQRAKARQLLAKRVRGGRR